MLTWRKVRALILASAVLMAPGALLVPSWAAPAPRPRALPAMTAGDFVGEWALEWGAGKGTCNLARDGGYYEQWYGTVWHGHWQFVPAMGASAKESAGTLTVTEYPIQADGALGRPLTWSATLKPRSREGILGNGGTFRLRFVHKARPDS